jgi:DNA-directed RNA polymerase subunit omega
MARVTVEDCITRIPNRFDLVMIAAQRTRQLAAGAPVTIERNNDRNPVVALREIAEVTVDTDKLKDAILNSFRQQVQAEASEEVAEHLAEETQTLRDFTPELSLTGELDEEEAALDAEFTELEKNLDTAVSEEE